MSKQEKEMKVKLTRAEKKEKRRQEIANMSPEEKAFYDFNNRWHLIGRIWNTIGILMILAVPLAICLYYNVSPNWAIFGDVGVITLMIINIGSGIVEPIIYAPMLGTNGEYLAFITGNLANLKIPCVVQAREIAETKIGTPENELVSTIAVAVSSLVTTLIIAIIVLCLAVSPLPEKINEAKYLTPAFGCVVYAIFGSLGGRYMVKNPKMALIPGLILVGISALISGVSHGKTNIGSASLIVGIVLCALFAGIQYAVERKKQKKQELADTVAPTENIEKINVDVDDINDDDVITKDDK